jgi:hypothetical protein
VGEPAIEVPPVVVHVPARRQVESDEFEVVWSGRDSLIPDRESRGSQLSGGEFSSGGRRNGART